MVNTFRMKKKRFHSIYTQYHRIQVNIFFRQHIYHSLEIHGLQGVINLRIVLLI